MKSPTPHLRRSLALLVMVVLIVSLSRTTFGQRAKAFYNPANGEVTIEVIAGNIATLSIAGQTGLVAMPGFVNFMAASGTTGLGDPLMDANVQFVTYNLGQDSSGNQITFTPGSYNIGAVFDPNLSFTDDPALPDQSEVRDAGGNLIGFAALDIDIGNFVPIRTQAVPEPGVLPLLVMGVTGLIARRQRKRA